LEARSVKKPKGDYLIQTVFNAVRVLDAFREREEYGVTELAQQLGLHKNNVFRLFATLEQAGYIEETADERYRLGVRCLEIGRAFQRGRSLVERARPLLEKLAAETQESAHLSLLSGFEALCVESVAPDRLVGTASRAGIRLPCHCTAAGKVLLACGSEGLRAKFDRSVSAGGGLPARTGQTIVDSHKFFEHLRTVRVEGFATDFEECEGGLVCAAAPVHDASGEVVAALSVSGPAFRLPEDRLLRDVVRLLIEAGEQLSRGLGYVA
jgi:DNA-binding IclR family transcriptional regulator